MKYLSLNKNVRNRFSLFLKVLSPPDVVMHQILSSNKLEIIKLSIIYLLALLINLAHSQVATNQTTLDAALKEPDRPIGGQSDEQPGLLNSSAPKDYPYQPDSSRVRDLIEVFEALNSRNYHRREKQEAIVSLSEAASRLFVFSNGLPLKTRCNKYVTLISKPNVLTYTAVDLLMEDDNQISEVEQSDAQPLSRLMNERKFDALGRLQTILQSIESEGSPGHLDYESNVKRDLLQCVSYYIYRHQRATLGLSGLVQDLSDKLSLEKEGQSGGVELILKRLRQSMLKLEEIETRISENEEFKSDWLKELTNLNDLARQNKYELPKLVRDFLTEPKRLSRLHSYDQLQIKAKSLASQLVELESGRSEFDLVGDVEYLGTLAKLNEIVESNKDLMPEDLHKLLIEPKRWKLIRAHSRLTADFADEKSLDDHDTKCGFASNDHDEPDENNLFHDDGLLKVSSAKLYCKKLSRKLDCMLRTFNSPLMNSAQAIKLARILSSYKIECIIRESDSSKSQWPILSLTRKLSGWCSSKLAQPNLAREDQASTAVVLKLLRSIRGEN